jgi:hypothetical protein
MHYKANRLNHDFQIAHFLAGSCRTPDAAWSLLSDLQEERSNALKCFTAYNLRDQAKIVRAERKLKSTDEASRLEGQADIEELRALAQTTQKNYDAALAELAFIEKCMAALEPLRKYAHLPVAQAHEAAQQEEWALQLVHTAENHLLSQNSIPADHWGAMRMHPQFSTHILPAIERTKKLMLSAGSNPEALTQHLESRSFDVPKLLAAG